MHSAEAARPDARFSPGFALCLAILAALTLARLVGLAFSTVDFYLDESQYWAWSREPAFGYYSKPPLLAWIIAAAESVCGAGEACLRSPAPLFYFGTGLLVFAVARTLYDSRVAFWAALTIALAPGVSFSSRIISTDVPFLFFFALALLAYVKQLPRPDVRWAMLLGVALGLGALAKYAMIYFLPGMALAAFLDREARTLLFSRTTLLALAIAAVLIAPNILWNVEHGFATFQHTGDNIRGSGLNLDPLKGLEFLAAQFAVFGPIAFATLLAALFYIGKADIPRADRLMLAFALPTLALVTVTAFVTRAHPNWAAATYIPGAVAVAAVLVRLEARRLLLASVAIGLFVQVALTAADTAADRLTIPGLARPDVYERTLGWRTLGTEADRLAQETGAQTTVAESRGELASLLYYHRDGMRRVRAWPPDGMPRNHFELTRPLTEDAAEPVLMITRCPQSARLEEYFSEVEPLDIFTASTGPTSERVYFAFRLSGGRGALGPLASCR